MTPATRGVLYDGPDKPILAVTGHRPHKLPDRQTGYLPNNPLRVWLRAQMRKEIERICPTEAISGMALGIDQDFVEICLDMGIPVCAAVPCDGQDSQWPKPSQAAYQHLLQRIVATGGRVHVVSPGGYAISKMGIRNRWMVDRCTVLMAIWDGSAGGTGGCVTYAKSVNKPWIHINPRDFDQGL